MPPPPPRKPSAQAQLPCPLLAKSPPANTSRKQESSPPSSSLTSSFTSFPAAAPLQTPVSGTAMSPAPLPAHRGACVHAPQEVWARNGQECSTEEVGSALGTEDGRPGRRRGGAAGSSGAAAARRPLEGRTQPASRLDPECGPAPPLRTKPAGKPELRPESWAWVSASFSKGLDSKYRRLHEPYSLGLNHSLRLMWYKSSDSQ